MYNSHVQRSIGALRNLEIAKSYMNRNNVGTVDVLIKYSSEIESTGSIRCGVHRLPP